jgi:holliday junction DNA helicase RuvB
MHQVKLRTSHYSWSIFQFVLVDNLFSIDASSIHASNHHFFAIVAFWHPFTLVGATTRSGGRLTSPLRARFGINSHLEYYETVLLAQIVQQSSLLLSVTIKTEAMHEFLCRSCETPRIANTLLRSACDFAQVKGDGTITKAIAQMALNALEVDTHG